MVLPPDQSFTLLATVLHCFRPDKSCLVLGKEVEEAPSIGDLGKVTRPRGQFAYLSACSTAETRAPCMDYESIHLVSAFQLMGFHHVVGSLWAVDDSAAVSLAAKFYDTLTHQDFNKNLIVTCRLHASLVSLKQERRNSVTGG
jgi:CHAT domain-containing protein